MTLQRITAEAFADAPLNVTMAQRHANIRSAIARGLPQVWPHGENRQRVALVGGGPSLRNATVLRELVEQAWRGDSLVAMNGAYGWLLEHQLWPSAYVQIDARPFNARFLAPGPVPVNRHRGACKYFLASQCAPEVFDAVRGWPEVYVFHATYGGDDRTIDPVEYEILDGYYLQQWRPICGGSTVLMRALYLFHLLGFRYFDLYGCDSCYDGPREHHAYAQPENDADPVIRITCGGREFWCAAWQVSQALELMAFIKQSGHALMLSIHGDGLLAWVLQLGAEAYEELKAQKVTA